MSTRSSITERLVTMIHSAPAIRRFQIAALRVRRSWNRCFPLWNDGPLAEPWRRLAAATVDTILIVLLAAIIDFLNLSYLDSSYSSPTVRLSYWFAALAWLYVLGGWSLGSTLGMRLFGIRLARIAGPERRIGLQCAAKRILGYWLACLPVKGGLIPILTHPLRQGWHDRIAGTIVIKRGQAAQAAELIARDSAKPVHARIAIPGELWPKPDLRLAWRGTGYAFAALLCLVIAMTYPVAWHLRTRVAGAAGDSEIFLWAQWYVPKMLQRHLPLTHTTYSFYPLDVSLAYSTMEWFNTFLAVPLSRCFNAAAVYNILWLGSLTLCVCTSYFLLAAVTRSRAAALALAPVFGLCAYFMAHGLGHDNLISAEFLPPLALCGYAWLTMGKARYAAAAGVFWMLAGWCDLQFIVFGAIILVAFLCAYWWGSPLREARQPIQSRLVLQLKQSAALLACFLVGMSWLLVPLLIIKLHGDSRYTDSMAQFPAHLEDYVAPSYFPSLTPTQRQGVGLFPKFPVENAVAPGLLVVALVIAAPLVLPRRSRRALRPWGYALLGAMVLSFGFVLTTQSQIATSIATVVGLLLAFPGNGFALPWHCESLVSAGLLVIGGDFGAVATVGQPFWLPSTWLWTMLPLIRTFRGTARLGAMADLSAAMIAAATLRQLLNRTRRKHGTLALAAGLAACWGVLCWEYNALPYITFVPYRSPAVASLRSGSPTSPVLEIPLSDNPDSLIDQTVHERPVFDGFLSRTPNSALLEIENNAFLVYAARQGDESSVAGRSRINNPNAADLRAGLADLQRIGLHDVIVRENKLSGKQIAEDEALLRSVGAVKTADDHVYAEVFHLPAPPTQNATSNLTRLSTKPPPR